MCHWMNELSIQRRSLYSNGLIVQTDDCKRIAEMISAMKAKYPEPLLMKKRNNGSWIRERWLILDGWDGLQELEWVQNNWKVNVLADAKKYGGELRSILPIASEELEKGDTVIIVQNILQTEKYLNNALRSWSTSDKIRSVDSTVIVFVEDACVFPSNVWSKMKVVDVPKSTDVERQRILKEQQVMMAAHPALSEAEEKAAARILAGMNLDQIDAAVIESLIRYNKVDIDALAKTKEDLLSRDPTLDIIQRPSLGFEAIGGYDALKNRLREDIIMPLKYPEYAEEFNMSPPRGMILYGPPGTGKTILTKAMSKELNMSVLVLRPENFLSKYVGESERSLKGAFKTAESMQPCIVMIDEVDRLSKRSGGGTDGGAQVHREIFSMLLEKLGDENRKWFFVGCTNRIEDIDEAMRRTGRIDSIAPVPYPNEAAREEILRIHASVKRNLPLEGSIDFRQLASNKYTYMWSGSDLEQLVVRTAKHVMKDAIKNQTKDRRIGQDDFLEILSTFNVNAQENERLQKETREQAQKFSNDKRLLDIFDEAQSVSAVSRAEKAKQLKDA